MKTEKAILALADIWGAPAGDGGVSNAYVKSLTESDLNVFMYVPQGMKIIKDMKLLYSQKNDQHNTTVQINSVSDANFAGDKVSRKVRKRGYIPCGRHDFRLDVPQTSFSIIIDYGRGVHVGVARLARSTWSTQDIY